MGLFVVGLALAASVVCTGIAEPVIDIHFHSQAHDSQFDARVPNPDDAKPMSVFNDADHARATAAALHEAGVVRVIVGGERRALDDRVVAYDPERLRGGFEVNDVPDAPCSSGRVMPPASSR